MVANSGPPVIKTVTSSQHKQIKCVLRSHIEYIFSFPSGEERMALLQRSLVLLCPPYLTSSSLKAALHHFTLHKKHCFFFLEVWVGLYKILNGIIHCQVSLNQINCLLLFLPKPVQTYESKVISTIVIQHYLSFFSTLV